MRKLQRIVVMTVACLLTAAAGAQETDTSAQGTDTGAPLTNNGTINFIPKWTGTTTLGNSTLFQATNGNVGVGLTNPSSKFDVKGGAQVRGIFRLPAIGTATATSGFNSNSFDQVGSSFNSNVGVAVNQTFRWQVFPLDNNTISPSGELSLAYGSGSNPPTPTGLTVSSSGLINFVSGQTFPGTGTITGVTAGTDLTGGGSSGTVTLNLDTTKVPQLATNNTFTGNQTVNGNVNVVGAHISVGGSRALSCTRSCGAIGSIPNGGETFYGLGSVAAPAGYSLTGCSAYWASSTSCGVIQYSATANITALDDGAGACHALGFNASGSTLESCACVTACQLP